MDDFKNMKKGYNTNYFSLKISGAGVPPNTLLAQKWCHHCTILIKTTVFKSHPVACSRNEWQ